MAVPKLKKYKDMINNLAVAVSESPFSMVRAAAALKLWISGDEPYATLDVSYCAMGNAARPRHRPVGPAPPNDQRVVGVEASPGEVEIVAIAGGAGGVEAGAAHNVRAHTLYIMAADLVREHNQDWPAAIKFAKTCMSRAGNLASLADAGDEDENAVPKLPLGEDM